MHGVQWLLNCVFVCVYENVNLVLSFRCVLLQIIGRSPVTPVYFVFPSLQRFLGMVRHMSTTAMT